MQIISGKYKNFTLPNVQNVPRPTTSMVKESIFSSLESIDAIENAVVFDLFAGSGALGFEALSRGSKSVVFYEKSSIVIKGLKDFVKKYNIDQDVIINKCDSYKNFDINKNSITNGSFCEEVTESIHDKILIFIDPPYNDNDDLVLDILKKINSYNLKNVTIVI